MNDSSLSRAPADLTDLGFSGQSEPPSNSKRRGWIFYDGQCRYCVAAARRFDPIFRRKGFEFVPLQAPWVQRQLGLDAGAPLDEMKVLTVSGLCFGGADSLIFLARQVWWGWPLRLIAPLPGMRSLLRSGYQWIAAHRGCNQAGCASSTPKTWTGWAPLIAFPVLALLTRGHLEPWVFMWLMAGSIFLGCKWLTFRRATRVNRDFSTKRALGYLCFWPGMDAVTFLNPWRAPERTGVKQGLAAPLLKTLSGVILLFLLARFATIPLLAGWIGMIGLVLILHFGLFAVAGSMWRGKGVEARPIMNAPIKSTSLSEFWGRRWNGAFNQLLLDLFFRRWSRSIGSARTTLLAFFVSGLIHELVISVPAGRGFGLPTGYFLVQGGGVMVQRTAWAKRHGLRRGLPGWIFTMLIVAGPAFWLFHPPFVRRVILPFMQAIGAL